MFRTLMLWAAMLFVVTCSAQAQLKIDFNQDDSETQSGYQAYSASHEDEDTFTSQSYSAFGATVTVTPSWAADAENTIMQMLDRGESDDYENATEDLMRDWIGSDTRSDGDPLTLTLSGLPSGSYNWLSYHSDTGTGADVGTFDVTVNDASGATTTNDIQCTNDSATTIEDVATFTTTLSSNGKDDVTIVFDLQDYSNQYNEAWFVMNGFEVTKEGDATQASAPVPTGDDLPLNLELSWTAGEGAVSHNVYFGLSQEDVNDATETNPLDVLVSLGQSETTYVPTGLTYGQTYYWRVDEVSSAVHKGHIWSVITEPYARTLTNLTVIDSGQSGDSDPNSVIDGSGLDANDFHSTDLEEMWISEGKEEQPAWIQFEFDRPYQLHDMQVWNSNQSMESSFGLGIKDVSIEISADGVTWTLFDANAVFNQGTGLSDYTANTVIDFTDTIAQFVKLTAKSNWGGLVNQYSLSEVRFSFIPTFARLPQPEDEDTLEELPELLSWRAGRQAVQHEVYMSTDANLVEACDSSVLLATTQEAELDIADQTVLEKDYFWKIVETNELEWDIEPRWAGPTWSFSTPAYLVVDDMESYDDVDRKIFNIWTDGYKIDENGSLVGHWDPPYAEQSIVNSGGQSMPFYYENTDGVTDAYGTLEFDSPQDWTQADVTSLIIHFYGQAENEGQLYAKIGNQKVLYNGDTADLAFPFWTPWIIDLTSLNVTNVGSLTLGVEGSTDDECMLLFDDIRLHANAPTLYERVWIESESGTLPQPWEILDDEDASGGQYIATAEGTESSIDAPLDTAIVTYDFTVEGGEYKVSIRIRGITDGDDDSLWIRVPNAAEDWARANSLPYDVDEEGWQWIEMTSDNGVSANYTLPAGTHTLEISYREVGVEMDQILIETVY